MNQPVEPDDIEAILSWLNDIYFWIWASFCMLISSLVGITSWLNKPAPSRTMGQALLAAVNGILMSLMVGLYLSDSLIRGEISISRFTLYVTLASMGGGTALQKLYEVLYNRMICLIEGNKNSPNKLK